MEHRPPSGEVRGREVLGVLTRSLPARLLEVSRSGCLLESRHPVEGGVIAELRLTIGGQVLLDDVRVTRCVRVEGSGSSYLVGAEFVQTRRPGESSIRRAVSAILREVIERQTRSRARTAGETSQVEASAGRNGNDDSTGEGVMRELLARFIREDEGQDLIEYGLLAGLITTLLVSAITLVGQQVQDYFDDLNTALPDVD